MRAAPLASGAPQPELEEGGHASGEGYTGGDSTGQSAPFDFGVRGQSLQAEDTDRHWLIPERKGLVYTELERYGDGDRLLQPSYILNP